MNINKYVKLLILVLITFKIQLNAQIVLSNNEYRFYVDALIDSQGLKKDTAIYKRQLKRCDSIEANKDLQIVGFNVVIENQKSIAKKDSIDYAKLNKAYKNKDFWGKFFKNVSITSIGVIIVETFFLILKSYSIL